MYESRKSEDQASDDALEAQGGGVNVRCEQEKSSR